MLEFNPHFRLTAQEALKSKIFDDIRVPSFEVPCDKKIDLGIFSANSFDYEKAQCLKYDIDDYK